MRQYRKTISSFLTKQSRFFELLNFALKQINIEKKDKILLKDQNNKVVL